LKEYTSLHPDVRDEDIRVILAPPPQPAMRVHEAPGRSPRLTPPPAYDAIDHAPNARVPIVHPVPVDPFQALYAPPLSPEHPVARDPPDFGELRRSPRPKRDTPVMDSILVPPQINPALRAPQLSNPLRALPSTPVLKPSSQDQPLHQPRPLRPLPLPSHLLQ
jgi:hypothetical protein